MELNFAVVDRPEILKMQQDAGLVYPPTQLTYIMRQAIAGQGPEAYTWKDKPHRLVYDLCKYIEEMEAFLAGPPSTVGTNSGVIRPSPIRS